MIVEDVKKELQDYRNDWQLLARIEEEIEYYDAKLTSCTAQLSATPKGTPEVADKIAEYIAKLEEVKANKFKQLIDLENKTERIENIVDSLAQPYKTLLHTTYIKKGEYVNEEGVAKIVVGCKLRETAYLMTYEYKYICKLHGKALLEYLKVRERYV